MTMTWGVDAADEALARCESGMGSERLTSPLPAGLTNPVGVHYPGPDKEVAMTNPPTLALALQEAEEVLFTVSRALVRTARLVIQVDEEEALALVNDIEDLGKIRTHLLRLADDLTTKEVAK